MTVGENIRMRRDHLGWSQRELARRTGIPQSNLSRIEAGHSPTMRTMAQIEATLRAAEKLTRTGTDPTASTTGQVTLSLPITVLRALQHLGHTGMFAGTTVEAVAEELLLDAVRRACSAPARSA